MGEERSLRGYPRRGEGGSPDGLIFAATGHNAEPTWIEARKPDGHPSAAAYEKFGFDPEGPGDSLLAVTDGVRRVDILDSSGSLSPRLLRYSSKHNGGLIPAAAGGVKSDAVLERNPLMGMAWEPKSGTDDTEALNRLVVSVSENGGGTVVLPPGATLASVTLAPGVSLAGSGQRITKLVLPNAANRAVVAVTPSASGHKNYRTEVRDVTLEGNRFNQTVWSKGAKWARNSLENYSAMPHGIWIARSEPRPDQDDEGLDLYNLVANVRINDVYGTAVFGWRGNGGTVFHNVVALRPGVGFISPPDCSWSDCTVGQAEFAGVRSLHGSVNYSNIKTWMSGTAVLKHPAPDGIAYRRRWANGWEFLGNGAAVTVSSCSSQNHSGHGLWIAQKTEGANIQMSVDANNTVPPWAMRADDDLEPWLTNEETIERQVFGDDGRTRADNPVRATTTSGHVGAYIEGSRNVLNISSNTAAEQDPGSFYGWQKHALAFGVEARENMVTVSHHSLTDTRPSGEVLRGGATGRNFVLGNGRILDQISS